tara:strand:+ start:130 stop:798 length:669 start_codon:yes stop_codon:yes gene_type:complete
MSEENQRVDALVEKLQERIEKSEVENANQMEVIAKGADEIIASQKEVIENLTKSLGELEGKFNTLFEKIEPMFDAFAKSVEGLVSADDIDNKIEKALETTVEPLNKEIEEVKANNEELVKNLDEVVAEKEELNKSVEALETEKLELEEKVENLENEPVVKSAQIEADLNPQEVVEKKLTRDDVVKSLIEEIQSPKTNNARKAEIRKSISRLEAGVSLESIKF